MNLSKHKLLALLLLVIAGAIGFYLYRPSVVEVPATEASAKPAPISSNASTTVAPLPAQAIVLPRSKQESPSALLPDFCHWLERESSVSREEITAFLRKHPNEGFNEEAIATIVKAAQELLRRSMEPFVPLHPDEHKNLPAPYNTMSREEIHQAGEDGDAMAANIIGRQLLHEGFSAPQFNPKSIAEAEKLLQQSCRNGWPQSCETLAQHFRMLSFVIWQQHSTVQQNDWSHWEIRRLAYERLLEQFGSVSYQMLRDFSAEQNEIINPQGQVMPDLTATHNAAIDSLRDELLQVTQMQQYHDEQREQADWILRRSLHLRLFELWEQDCTDASHQ